MPVCLLCERSFPYSVVIDGKRRNLKSRKYCLECSPFGAHNTSQLHPGGKKRTTRYLEEGEKRCCPRCKRNLHREEFYVYKGGRLTTYCKLCNLKDVHKRSLAFKVACVEYKGGECMRCGYEGHPAAFDFHHRDPAEKDFVLSKYRLRAKITKEVTDELDKCDLLCAICHRIEHFKAEYS